MSDKAIVTCALNGVLTDPRQHKVPVTPDEMAQAAKSAFNAGASRHAYSSAASGGRTPAISHPGIPCFSARCKTPFGRRAPASSSITRPASSAHSHHALACVRETRPDMAACNAGSLNYLKVKADNSWAWKPMLFDNPVEKIQAYIDVMKEAGKFPEFECFDVGIVRCVEMYSRTGMYSGPLQYNFVMGVASGMPADPDLLPILLRLKVPEANWQVTAIGRGEIWPLHQLCAELGGHLRTGLEDTFYLGDGTKVTSNGKLVESRRPVRAAPAGSRESRRGAADFRDFAVSGSVLMVRSALLRASRTIKQRGTSHPSRRRKCASSG